MNPQRPYKRAAQNVAPKLTMRHENGRMDCTVKSEKMARPFGAAPRTVKGWQ